MTALKDGVARNAITLPASPLNAVLSGLEGGSYTFRVVGLNGFIYEGSPGISNGLTVTGGQTYAGQVVDDGSVLYWRLGDPGAFAADSSGQSRLGIYSGGPGHSAGAQPNDSNQSVEMHGDSLNGTTINFLQGTGLPAGNSARSVEAWFKTGNEGLLFRYQGGSGSHPRLWAWLQWGGTIRIDLGDEDHYFSTPRPLQSGTWHHLMVTYTGPGAPANTLTVYIDGQAIRSDTLGQPLSTGGGMFLGRGDCGGLGCQGWYNGSLDDLAVYPTALSPAQDQSHFGAGGNSLPSAPGGVTGTGIGDNQGMVTWSPSTVGGYPVTSYTVTALKDGTARRQAVNVPASTSSAVISGLEGGSYTYQVTGANAFVWDGPAGTSLQASVGGGATYSSTVIADGAGFYWRLGDAGGLSPDSSGHVTEGTYYGGHTRVPGAILGDPDDASQLAPGQWVEYNYGQGLPSGNSARTYESWFNIANSSAHWLTAYGNGGSHQSFWIFLDGGNLVRIRLGDQDLTFTAAQSFANSRWHHLGVTYDGAPNNQVAVYLDGTQVGTAQTVSGGLSTNNNLVVGRAGCNLFGCDWYDGSVDEVAAYPAVLTPAQIAQHYALSGQSPAGNPPGAPTNVTADASGGDNQAVVTWTAPSDTGDSPITAYTVTPHATDGTLRTPVTVTGNPAPTSATVTGLSSDAALTFTVVATNAGGDGPASDQSNLVIPTGAVYPYAGTVLGDDPVAHWRLGETSRTTALDLTGTGNSGVYQGGYAQGQPGPIAGDPGRSVGLNGATGVVRAPSTPGLSITGALTIEAWVKFAGAAGTQFIVTKGDGCCLASYEIAYVQGQGLLFTTYNGAATSAVYPFSPVIGQWYHVVGVRSADGFMTLYVDGQAVANNADGGAPLNNVSAAVGLGGSGAGSQSNLKPFNGTLGEVAIYRAALTPDRVQAHWQLGGATPGAPTGVTADASGGDNQALVTWTPPSYTGTSAITSYTVTPYSGSRPGTPAVVAATATSATVTRLSADGHAYTFKVEANNASGPGHASDASSLVVPTGAVYPYAANVESDAPAAYWRLGETGGSTAVDSSGGGDAARYSGGFTLGQPGALPSDPNTSVLLNGSTGVVRAPNAAAVRITGALSVEAWVYFTDLSGNQLIVDKGDAQTAAHNAYELGWIAGQGFDFATWKGGTGYRATYTNFTPVLNRWYHLVGTRTAAGALTLYVNGASVATASDGGGSLNDVGAGVGMGGSSRPMKKGFGPAASSALWRPCGPSSGSFSALLVHASFRCAHSGARKCTRIWTTWITKSLGDPFSSACWALGGDGAPAAARPPG